MGRGREATEWKKNGFPGRTAWVDVKMKGIVFWVKVSVWKEYPKMYPKSTQGDQEGLKRYPIDVYESMTQTKNSMN